MSDQYLGEIRMVGFNFAPSGWALCNGQILSINQNSPLFALLGTLYGGNGVSTFALPDLQGRVPIHWGQGVGLSPYVIGQNGGSESINLLATQMPSHSHLMNVNNTDATAIDPSGAFLAKTNNGDVRSLQEYPTYAMSATSGKTLAAAAIANTGGGQSHPNIQPYLAVTFIIALSGIFPSRN